MLLPFPRFFGVNVANEVGRQHHGETGLSLRTELIHFLQWWDVEWSDEEFLSWSAHVTTY